MRIKKANFPTPDNPRFIFLMIIILLSFGCTKSPDDVTRLSDKVNFIHLEGFLAAPPAIDQEFMYVSNGKGSLHKLETGSGQIIWTYDDIGGYVSNSPILTEESVIIIGSRGYLTAVDKETGQKKWQKPEEPETEWSLGSTKLGMPTVSGCLGYDPLKQIIIMGDIQGRVYGVASQDGSLISTKALKAKIIAPPQFKEHVVFIATMGGRLHALHVTDGSDYWAAPKVIVTGLEGSIEIPEDEDAAAPKDYFITLTYKYNFSPDDYFGNKEQSAIEITLLDENNAPLSFIEKEEEKGSIVIKDIDPGDYIALGSQSQKKELQLASPPDKQQNFAVTVIVKDSEGNMIHALEAMVNFKLVEEE